MENFRCRVSKRLSQRLNSTYRFWAVFENSLCDDYLSEKVYFAMEHNVIPIVYSGITEYEHFMPPNSYIDANKFASVEELAKHLKMLSQDPKEYIKYFHYKLNYRSLWTVDFCNLCIKLSEPNLEEKVSIYNDIEKWVNFLHFPILLKFPILLNLKNFLVILVGGWKDSVCVPN